MHAQRRASGWTAGERSKALERLRSATDSWDLIIIGGGITGAGILREAARRGWRALLVEQCDFAWGTSSRSSKMVHGGLRYLAAGQYRLTRDAVSERERLLAEAPGLVERMQYLQPHYRGQFPSPRLMRVLLWLYDRIAGQRSRAFHPAAETRAWLPELQADALIGASRFADAVTDDARLVLRTLSEALADGAMAVNYLAAIDILREDGEACGARLRDQLSGEEFTLRAPVVINATGAWADRLRSQASIRPLRGSHLVLPYWRLPVPCSVSFPHPADRRPVFVFPWEGVTVIGTTDLDHDRSLDDEARISDAEVDYLLAAAKQIFPGRSLRRADIQATWSGVRPVVAGGADAPSKEKREHVLWDDHGLISVAGGKLTTFRLIALDVLRLAAPRLPPARPVRGNEPLFRPLPADSAPAAVSPGAWRRLQGRYGVDAPKVLACGAAEPIGASTTLWAELGWAAANEAVVHLDDLLLRRTRLGLLLPDGGVRLLPRIRAFCQPLLGWPDARWAQEEQRYRKLWQRYYGPPGRTDSDDLTKEPSP